jgi:hypothetical protein
LLYKHAILLNRNNIKFYVAHRQVGGGESKALPFEKKARLKAGSDGY